jgi:hypothetical protein
MPEPASMEMQPSSHLASEALSKYLREVCQFPMHRAIGGSGTDEERLLSSGPPPEPMTTTSTVCWDIEEEGSRKAEGVCGEEGGRKGVVLSKRCAVVRIYRAGIGCRVANWFGEIVVAAMTWLLWNNEQQTHPSAREGKLQKHRRVWPVGTVAALSSVGRSGPPFVAHHIDVGRFTTSSLFDWLRKQDEHNWKVPYVPVRFRAALPMCVILYSMLTPRRRNHSRCVPHI